MDEDHRVVDAYDAIAEEYATETEASAYNAHHAFPGTTSLVPDTTGHVLDAGCGTGQYTTWLRDQGFAVTGIDASREMLAHATDRVTDVDVCQADLGTDLPFTDDSFDGVLSALVLNYLRDWDPIFEEFARVLRPGGFLVVCVTHPFDEFPLAEAESYFEVGARTKEWSVDIPYYRRPLTAVLNPVLDAGFALDELGEPEPTERFRELCPDRYEKESRHPVFLAFRATLPDA
ncbi:MAG: class I SAM-dependent methyltransferase [Halobacteriaceae archaeon]